MGGGGGVICALGSTSAFARAPTKLMPDVVLPATFSAYTVPSSLLPHPVELCRDPRLKLTCLLGDGLSIRDFLGMLNLFIGEVVVFVRFFRVVKREMGGGTTYHHHSPPTPCFILVYKDFIFNFVKTR